MKKLIKKFFTIHYNSVSVFEYFNIERLKQDNIKYIVFDLDNTLCTNTNHKASQMEIDFLNTLRQDFDIIICSNNTKQRVSTYQQSLPFEINAYNWCVKPAKFKIKRIMKQNNFIPEQTLFVGDQLITDIIISNRMKSKILFVKPLHQKELKLTKFNRNFENFILNKINKYKLVNWGEKW